MFSNLLFLLYVLLGCRFLAVLQVVLVLEELACVVETRLGISGVMGLEISDVIFVVVGCLARRLL